MDPDKRIDQTCKALVEHSSIQTDRESYRCGASRRVRLEAPNVLAKREAVEDNALPNLVECTDLLHEQNVYHSLDPCTLIRL